MKVTEEAVRLLRSARHSFARGTQKRPAGAGQSDASSRNVGTPFLDAVARINGEGSFMPVIAGSGNLNEVALASGPDDRLFKT